MALPAYPGPFRIPQRGSTVTVIVNDTEWHHLAAERGVLYTYTVSSLYEGGEGGGSGYLTTCPIFELPSEPFNLSANREEGRIWLNWSRPADDGGALVKSYNVHRGTSEQSMELMTTLLGGPSFDWGWEEPHPYLLDHGNLEDEYYWNKHDNFGQSKAGREGWLTTRLLDDDRTYFYQVSMVDAAGEGPRSEVLVVPPYGTPGEVGNLSCSLVGRRATVYWMEAETIEGYDVVSYRIYRWTDSDEPKLVGDLPADTFGFRDGRLREARVYQYSVSAVNERGEGPMALPVTVQVPRVEEDGSDSDGWLTSESPLAVMMVIAAFLVVLLFLYAYTSTRRRRRR